MILSTVGEKGGPGKSTVAVNLAVYWALNGHDVQIINLDPQSSLGDWHKIRREEGIETIDVCSLQGDLKKSIRAIANENDITILDVPGRDDKIQRTALLLSDLAIAVLSPGAFDFMAAPHTFEMIEEAQELRKTIDEDNPLLACVVFNKTRSRSTIVKQMRDSIIERNEELEETSIELLDSELRLLDDFIYSAMNGLGVVERDSGSDAAIQVKNMAIEIENLLLEAQAEEEQPEEYFDAAE